MSRRFSRLLFSIVATTSIFGATMGTAQAYQIKPDIQKDQCVVDTSAQSSLSTFWTNLEAWTAEARIAEINAKDPGLGDLMLQWTPDQSAAEIQQRLNALGDKDNFGMLLDMRDKNSADPSAGTEGQDLKKTYTEDEARQAAANIKDDAAQDAESQLQHMADQGTALDKTRLAQFQAHREEYNQAQQELKEQFLNCADQLKDARPTPTWVWVVGILGGLALIALAARAYVNSRRPSRHYR